MTRGVSYGALAPDRIAMQDATAQMALLQFMTAGLDEVAVPTTIHCDHLIRAEHNAAADLQEAQLTNREVYEFLRTASEKYGIGFWEPGSGIIHQVILEQYAFPGGLMIGTDSHTPNAGGLGMIAIGVGGADAVDVMVGDAFGLRWPKLIGVELTGVPSGWTSAKDVILKVAQQLTVKGGTGAIVEYFGPGVAHLSATGRATICNMGAEIGATTSLFPFDERTATYLSATGRSDLGALGRDAASLLRADDDVASDPESVFDAVIRIDLGSLEPQIVGPHTPDRGRSTSQLADEIMAESWPDRISTALVGSCTNSSYEDLSKAAHLARQARTRGLHTTVPLYITPGSERVRATIERDGILADLEAIGGIVLANACGPCIGQWKRSDISPGERNAILTSYNRNFPRRNDGNAATLAFIASPEVVVAYALADSFALDATTALLADGKPLDVPEGDELPARGFLDAEAFFHAPALDGNSLTVSIDPTSERLQLLTPFPSLSPSDFAHLAVLAKAKGKCTTDHISAAGPWLRYRGHLENICQNLFLGVNNVFTELSGTGIDVRDETIAPLPELARSYRDAQIHWVVIGDENYGEGSSREHAAMEPRQMNGVAIISRSFARIHETNLKKQGMLPLTFVHRDDYELIESQDLITIHDVDRLAPDTAVRVSIQHVDGRVDEIQCAHSLSAEQLEWFHAGGALNVIRERARQRS